MIDGETKLYFGTLCVVSAYNLGSCAVGGFKEGSMAYRGCRHCIATPEQLKSKFELDFMLRTPATHQQQCVLLESKSRPSRVSFSKDTGINHTSVLDELQFFSVASGALLPDVMQDVLEGVLQYEAKLLLRHLIFKHKIATY